MRASELTPEERLAALEEHAAQLSEAYEELANRPFTKYRWLRILIVIGLITSLALSTWAVVRSSLNAQQNDCANALLLIDRDVRTELTVDDIEAGCSGSFLGVFHIKDDILESYESP